MRNGMKLQSEFAKPKTSLTARSEASVQRNA